MKKITNKFINKTKIAVLIWNISAFIYHYYYIDIDLKPSILMQAFALIIEWIIADWYEKLLYKSEEMIKKTEFRHTITLRYLFYSMVFLFVYGGTYIIRMGILYKLNLINEAKTITGIIHMIVLCVTGGALWGFIVTYKKNNPKTSRSSDGRTFFY